MYGKWGIREICFCCIGCGTHLLPINDASKIAVYSVVKYLMELCVGKSDGKDDENEEKKQDDDGDNEKKFVYEYFDKIVFNCFTENELDAWKCWLQEQLG